MWSRWFAILALIVGLGMILVACGDDDEDASPTSEPTGLVIPELDAPTAIPLPVAVDDPHFPIQPAYTEAGRDLYEQHCGECHGINGEGQQPDPAIQYLAPPHDDTGHTWHHADQQNFLAVWTGRDIAGTMPGFSQTLTEDEIFQILAYIKTFWSQDNLAVQIERTQSIIANN